MRGLEMIANTCVTDVTGHPACSVPGRAGERPPDRNDDHRQAVGRRDRAPRRAHVRAGRRGLPAADVRNAWGASRERRARPRRHRRARPRARARERAGVPGGLGEGGVRHVLHAVPGGLLRRRRVPLRHRADAPGGLPALALLRALGAHRRALRRGQGRARRGRDRRAHAVLPGEPGRAAAAARRPGPDGVRRLGREERACPPRARRTHRRSSPSATASRSSTTPRSATPARPATSAARPASSRWRTAR